MESIICNNDMEIILKGSSKETIRKMLDNRLFALIKMSAKKSDEHRSNFSSSVFVADVNNFFSMSFAVRPAGAKTVYEDCEYYLTMYRKRGIDEESKGYFDRHMIDDEDDVISVTYPNAEELIKFLCDKEIFLITNWMQYGNFEQIKVKDFLENILFLRKESGSDFIQTDDFCDVRIYLMRVDDNTSQDNGFHAEDVRCFDIRNWAVDTFKDISKKYFSNRKKYSDLYYSAEFETQQKEIRAAYFVTRFHSNLNWKADPVNIVTAKLSAFILPGTVMPEKIKNLPADRKTKNLVTGEEYMIDSIHFNSDIFYDFTGFEEYLDNYFYYITLD